MSDMPGGSPAEGGGAEPEKPKRAPHPDAGKYVVLAAAVEYDAAEGNDATEQGVAKPGAFHPVTGGSAVDGKIEAAGQREAKKLAVEGSEGLQQAANGEGVYLVAVPASSWQPSLVKTEQPPPIMRGL